MNQSQITLNETTYKADPADYEAIENPNWLCHLDDNSKRCAFYNGNCLADESLFPCIPSKRADKKHVIFIKKEPQMKPFNIEAAIRGEKVITREGKEVTQLIKFENVREDVEPLFGVVESIVYSWSIEGRFYTDLEDHKRDLFMAPQTREGWINIYPPEDNTYTAAVSDAHATKEIADNTCNPHRRLACIRIEWEE